MSLRRSSPVVLVAVGAVGLVVGRVVRPLAEARGDIAPTIPWAAPVTLVLLAVAVSWLAWTTHQSVQKQRRLIASERAVRLLAFAKASAVVGAGIAGYYLGFGFSFVGDLDAALPRQRVIRAAVAVIASGVAVAGGLLLERACEVPKPPDDTQAAA